MRLKPLLCICLVLLALLGQTVAAGTCAMGASSNSELQTVQPETAHHTTHEHCGGADPVAEPAPLAMECCGDEGCPMQLCVGSLFNASYVPELSLFGHTPLYSWLQESAPVSLASSLYRPPISA